MVSVWTYTLASVIIVSLISLIGVVALSVKPARLHRMLLYLVGLSAGALFGDAFLHLLPEVVERSGFTTRISLYVLAGIVVSFMTEKFVHWHHRHGRDEHHALHKTHGHGIQTFAVMNLFGEAIHNFIDGLIIGASYLVSVPVGIATTLAVVFHEIPGEIGDFGVLVHGGFPVRKAIMVNFLVALTAVLGAVIALLLGSVEGLTTFLLPFAAGSFIYIAGSNLVPELQKELKAEHSLVQLLALVAGILLMFALTLLE